MDYQEFKTYVSRNLSTVIGEEVNIYPITKNNTVVKDGIYIETAIDQESYPTVYLDQFYELYQSGMPAPAIIKDLADIYEDRSNRRMIRIDLFQDYNYIKDKIAKKIINREKNENILSKIPHRSFLDLEIVYYVFLEDMFGTVATVLIEKTHLEIWGIDEKQLEEDADANMDRLFSFKIQRMDQAMKTLLREDLENLIKYDENNIIDEEACQQQISNLIKKMEQEQLENPIPLYVLTNDKRMYGASGMLKNDLLQAFGDKFDSDFYILPSSIHEVILLPYAEQYEKKELTDMVYEINHTQVLPEEILSNSVYRYDRNMGIITM